MQATSGAGAGRLLGYGGLIPFYVAVVCIAVGDIRLVTLGDAALRAYAAVILSFVGAVNWGLALRGGSGVRTSVLAWSVVPALVAWVALLFSWGIGYVLLLAGFIASYLGERRYIKAVAPAWYVRLRSHLTAMACVALVLGLLGVGSALGILSTG